MVTIPFPTDVMTLSSPEAGELEGPLEDAIVHCLAAAFGSGVWARSPMPVGDAADPHSARGIVAQLKARARVLVATRGTRDGATKRERVIGCVLGCALDADLVDAYGLDGFGARAGDALLAYIGVEPASQGSRARGLSATRFAMQPKDAGQGGESVAGALFSRWLALPGVAECPQVYVRTRSVLRPVLHMIEQNGFDYRGKFELDFHGERQERLVFARANARSATGPEPVREAAAVRQMTV